MLEENIRKEGVLEMTTVEFEFLKKTYAADVEYFEPLTVMPYYKVTVQDTELQREFGMIHNFKVEIENNWVVLKPALEPQGKYHAYFWTCIMASLYILLLNKSSAPADVVADAHS